MSIDPIGIAGGLNLYLYANGDPIFNTDKLGLLVLDDPSADEALKEGVKLIVAADAMAVGIPPDKAAECVENAWNAAEIAKSVYDAYEQSKDSNESDECPDDGPTPTPVPLPIPKELQ